MAGRSWRSEPRTSALGKIWWKASRYAWSGSPTMSSSSSPSVVADTHAAPPASVSRLRLAAGSAWALLLAFPIIPVMVVLVVSFFEPTLSGFNRVFTLDNYRLLADSDVFIRTLGNTVL